MHHPDPGEQGLRFVAARWRHLVASGGHPLVILERGLPWDDYGYKTLFQVYYSPGRNENPQHLGAVKILQRDAKVTHLPTEAMDGLDESCCSLGQDLDYYENVQALGHDTARAILCGLRDMVLDPTIFERFQEAEGLERSLLRSPAAQIARRDAGRLLQRQPLAHSAPFYFDFSCELKDSGFSEPHHIRFEFFSSGWPARPHRGPGRPERHRQERCSGHWPGN
jgi:hypothetical protein